MIELNWKMFLIVCPMVFLAGLVDSIGGGGGLISLPAYLLAGLPIHNATATNKLSSSMGATVAAFRICRKQTVKWHMILPAIALSLCGSYAGTRLNLLTGDDILKKVLLFVLPVVVVVVFSQKKEQKEDGKRLPPKLEYAVVWAGALVMGMYDGFYGPGTGTFLMLIFMGIAKMGVIEAACYTKLLNLSSNIASLTTFLLSGKCIVILGIAAGLCSMAGSYVGSGLVLNNGKKIVRPIIIFVLILLFLKIILGW